MPTFLRVARRRPPPPTLPSQILNFSDYELVLPTNSTGLPSPADGVLRYTAANVAGSGPNTLFPVGDFTYRYFRVQQAPDGVYEVVMRAPISGSPTTPNPPNGGTNENDHTRVEFRQRTPGPGNHFTSGKGDFQLADRLQMWGVCRPTRFPDRDNNGSTTAANNLTLMQLQPTDGTAGALSTFVILALRKDGLLEATMRGADNVSISASPNQTADDLLTGVQLGDVIWWRLTTSATQIYWEAENRTRARGVIRTLLLTVPDSTAAGQNTRTRYYSHKFGCYHGTNVNRSSDDALRNPTTGIVAHEDVSDYAEVCYRQQGFRYLGP